MAGEVTPFARGSWNPLRCGGTPLPLPLLLAAKLLALCVVLRLVWLTLPEPFLPFLPVFDYFRQTPLLFAWALRITVLIGSLAVFFNYRVRLACLLVGSAFLVGVLSSRVYFENNRMFVGCLFLLLGLYEPRTGPRLIRAQVILVYFGAGLNKILDPSWRSGEFFQYWASLFVRRSPYFQVASWLPAMLLPRVMSWLTIAMELSMFVGLLFRRFRIGAIWLGLLLTVGMNCLTERTFGIFFYAMPISYLTFISWPRSKIQVLYEGNCALCSWISRLLQRLDFDELFAWNPFQAAEGTRQRLCVVADKKKYSGFSALKILTLYNPVTFFVLLVPLIAPQPKFLHYRSWLALSLMFFFSPIFAPVGEAIYAKISRLLHRSLPARVVQVGTSRIPTLGYRARMLLLRK